MTPISGSTIFPTLVDNVDIVHASDEMAAYTAINALENAMISGSSGSGTYTNPSSITVNANGQVTSVTSGSGSTSTASSNGWNDLSTGAAASLTGYSGNSGSTISVVLAGNTGGSINVGDKIAYTSSAGSTVYAIITELSGYSSGSTTYLAYTNNVFSGASGTVTNFKYSHVQHPVGFPADPRKFTNKVTYSTPGSIALPTQNQKYPVGQIYMHKGIWDVEVSGFQMVLDANADIVTMALTFSSGSTTESDPEMTAAIGGNGATATTMTVRQTSLIKGVVEVGSAGYYYINIFSYSSGMDSLTLLGDVRPTVIKAKLAYF